VDTLHGSKQKWDVEVEEAWDGRGVESRQAGLPLGERGTQRFYGYQKWAWEDRARVAMGRNLSPYTPNLNMFNKI
jgi:hypothetical protein